MRLVIVLLTTGRSAIGPALSDHVLHAFAHSLIGLTSIH